MMPRSPNTSTVLGEHGHPVLLNCGTGTFLRVRFVSRRSTQMSAFWGYARRGISNVNLIPWTVELTAMVERIVTEPSRAGKDAAISTKDMSRQVFTIRP
jgi:hypothetical protein